MGANLPMGANLRVITVVHDLDLSGADVFLISMIYFCKLIMLPGTGRTSTICIYYSYSVCR